MTEQEHDVSWALKLLEREPEYEENLIAKYFQPMYMGAIFGAAPAIANAVYKRPLWAGIQSHLIYMVAGVAFGLFLDNRTRTVRAVNDAKFRDYITRHPEDFPPPVRVKYADAFAPWVPIR